MPLTTQVIPKRGLSPTIVGAAQVAARRQLWGRGSATSLTNILVESDGTPVLAAPIVATLYTLPSAPGGEQPVPAVTAFVIAPVPETPGAFRSTVPAQTSAALPLGIYTLRTVSDPNDPALRQEVECEVEVVVAQGVSGIAPPFRTVTETIEVGVPTVDESAILRALAGLPVFR